MARLGALAAETGERWSAILAMDFGEVDFALACVAAYRAEVKAASE